MGVIRFGTDGWRARMGREFSFNNVRIFTQAYFNYLSRKYAGKELNVLVNYDTRFLSKQFAAETSKMFSLLGVKTIVPIRDAPLPAVSLATIHNRCSGAINFTASFNKPIFNGIKVFDHRGAPSLPTETNLIEKEVDKIQSDFKFKPQYPVTELIENIDVRNNYIDYIENIIDFDLIRNSGIVIAVDNLYGSSREYLDYVLSKNEVEIESIHNFPYSSFGAVIPSCSEENLRGLSQLVGEKKADIGLATDIDGDRFGIVDARGRYISANMIIPPLIEYLITIRKMEGGIVKSLSTTEYIQRVADHYLRKVYTTPVGFKYVAEMLSKRKTFIGVESTNGASLNKGITIKDGILFNLLVTEMLAYYKRDIDKILRNFSMKFSKLVDREISVKATNTRKRKYSDLMKNPHIRVNGYKPKEVVLDDGIKFILEDSWLLLRESGTDELIRISDVDCAFYLYHYPDILFWRGWDT
jgi:phosphoglucomutase